MKKADIDSNEESLTLTLVKKADFDYDEESWLWL